MTANHHVDPEDLLLFALQFLSPEEDAAIRGHLAQCAACREQLSFAQGDLALVASTAELHSPPALALDHLMQAIAREPRQRPASAPAGATSAETRSGKAAPSPPDRAATARRPSPRSLPGPALPQVLWRVLPWSGWVVAAGLALLVNTAFHESDSLRNAVTASSQQVSQVTAQAAEARRLLETLTDPSAQRVTLSLSKSPAVPQAKATYVPAKGALVLIASNLAPLEPAKTYELWIIPASGRPPLAAGAFQPDAAGNADLILPRLPAGVPASAFGITIEDQGSAAQTPTMPIIMAGAAGL